MAVDKDLLAYRESTHTKLNLPLLAVLAYL